MAKQSSFNSRPDAGQPQPADPTGANAAHGFSAGDLEYFKIPRTLARQLGVHLEWHRQCLRQLQAGAAAISGIGDDDHTRAVLLADLMCRAIEAMFEDNEKDQRFADRLSLALQEVCA